jgi:hypothetical protein
MRRILRAVGRHLWTGLGLLAFGSWYTPPWQWAVPSSSRRRRPAPSPARPVLARPVEPDVPLTPAEQEAWRGLERRLLTPSWED